MALLILKTPFLSVVFLKNTDALMIMDWLIFFLHHFYFLFCQFMKRHKGLNMYECENVHPLFSNLYHLLAQWWSGTGTLVLLLPLSSPLHWQITCSCWVCWGTKCDVTELKEQNRDRKCCSAALPGCTRLPYTVNAFMCLCSVCDIWNHFTAKWKPARIPFPQALSNQCSSNRIHTTRLHLNTSVLSWLCNSHSQ